MTSRRCAAFTWVEMLVAIVVIAVLVALLALQPIPSVHPGYPGSQTLSNMKQLYTATLSMTLDGTTTGDSNRAWPGSTGGTFATWAKNLVPEYLATEDFCQLLSAPQFQIDPRTLPTNNQNAILAYAVTEEQDGNTVFLTTANFTNTPAGGSPLRADAKPFGDRFFLVFRKGGDGKMLRAKEAGNTNKIGLYARLLR